MAETQPGGAAPHILVVDDEPNIRRTLALCLQGEGYRVTTASSGREALEEVSHRYFDIAFLDIRLGDFSGLDLISKFQAANPGLRVILVTAYASIGTAVEGIKLGAFDFLPKPFTPEQVTLSARSALHARDEESRLEELDQHGLKADLDSQVPVVRRAFELARQAADTEATLLIRGETGTGKGVLVRAIHAWSPRHGGPFSVVSCPAIPMELLESELFGHVQGSFTGAHREQPGRVAQSAGGTLFLDEIGDLPLPLQAKILRFIQDHEYERLGDPQTRRADVRIIAATNVDLKAAVAVGRFREDLYYRLNVIEIVLPPLRERLEDIPRLAQGMLRRRAQENGREGLRFSRAAEATLLSHAWPGNLRELNNAVERAVVLSRGPEVDFVDLKTETLLVRPEGVGSGRPGDEISLERLEEQHIRRVLEGRRSLEDAARILGIDISTLWRKRKKYGIDVEGKAGAP